LEARAQVTKQGTVIQKVGEHEIRHTSKGLNVEGNVGDDVLIELIARAAERFQGSLAAYGPAEFQRRVARVAGANHLAVSFEDPELEKARLLPRQRPQRRSIRLRLSILPSATQNEIGFPIYHFTGYGARRTPAKSHLLGCVRSLSKTS